MEVWGSGLLGILSSGLRRDAKALRNDPGYVLQGELGLGDNGKENGSD